MTKDGKRCACGRLGVLLAITAAMIVFVAVCLPAAASAATAKTWTVMVYLDADNSLEKLGPTDFVNELCNPGSASNVNVVTVFDRGYKKDNSYGGWTDTKLFYCTAGETPTAANALADWGERDMGNPQTMIDFINYCKTNYPAQHYILCLWDHGYSWYPGYYTVRDDTGANGKATSLDLDKQAAALAAVGGVDVVGSDQCQQAMIENLSVWQPYVKTVCASEDTVNNTGLNYGAITAALQATPTMTAEQAANMMGQTTTSPTDSLTYSVIQLDSRFTALETAVNTWASALKAGLAANSAAYAAARTATQKFADTSELDLYDAANQIKAKVADPVIKADCDAVMAAVNSDVTFNWTNGSSGEARAHGIAIWWPTGSLQYKMNDSSIDDWAYYTTKIPFGATNAWSPFLSASVH
jgi:hypothetical protein